MTFAGNSLVRLIDMVMQNYFTHHNLLINCDKRLHKC